MKDQLIITISDINGSKQYTLHQFIKVFILWIVIGITILLVVGSLTMNSLSTKVTDLNDFTKQLQEKEEKLASQNSYLELNILQKSDTLDSMSEQLSEIERIIGVESDINSTFLDRANNAKDKSLEKLELSKLNAAQIAILNRSIPNGKPIEYKRISAGFGYRINPVTKRKHHHSGIDMPAKQGTPIYAPADGVVEYAKAKGTYGNYLLVNHPFGFKTAYGHLQKFAVKSGDYILKGELIGYVGNTGRSTGSHLHYEIRYLHKWLDPEKFLSWSKDTYGSIMASERLVDWANLMNQIQKRLQSQNINKTQLARIHNGTF